MLRPEASSVLRDLGLRATQIVTTRLWLRWGGRGSEGGGTSFPLLPRPPAPAIPSLATRGQQKLAGPIPEGPWRPFGAAVEIPSFRLGTQWVSLLGSPMPPSGLPTNVYIVRS